MSKAWLTRGLALLGFAGVMASGAMASYNFSEGVQNVDSDPSPGFSGINNYTNQDEQINLDSRTGEVRVLRTNQKNLVNDYVTELIPISNVAGREIRSAFRSATGLEGGQAQVIRDKVSGKSFIQVICPQYQLPYLRAAVRALDESWVEEYNDGAGDLYQKMRFRDAAAVDLIAATYGDNVTGFTVIDKTNNATRRFDEAYRLEEYKSAVEVVDIPENEVTLDVKVYSVVLSDDLKLGLDYIAWSNGPGRSLWSFAVAGYDNNHRAKNLDGSFDPFGGLLVPDAFAAAGFGGKNEVGNISARESYRALNYVLPSNYFDFLRAKGQATVVSSQTITVRSADTGHISADEQLVALVNNTNEITDVSNTEPIPFVVGYDRVRRTAWADTNGNGVVDKGEIVFGPLIDVDAPTTTPKVDADRSLNFNTAGTVGMSLDVTPYIGTESMELAITLDLSEQTGVSGNGTPTISSRSLDTTVRLLPGQPYVIAGLSRTNSVKNTAKAPWLGDLPILGYLVGGETNADRKTDTVVTITPTFHLSSDHKIGVPASVETLKQVASGDAAQSLPDSSVGYDQWLIKGNLPL